MHNMDISRRALLRGRIAQAAQQAEPNRFAPPWFITAAATDGACLNCSACIDACPTSILELNAKGVASVNFEKGECEFCGDCAQVCPQPFYHDATAQPAWPLVADINERCLSQQGVVCQTCKEMCPVDAIALTLVLGQVPVPSIQQDLCTGCGACIAPCPTQAIDILTPENPNYSATANQPSVRTPSQ